METTQMRVRLYPRQQQVVDRLAAIYCAGNKSAALRRIINEWALICEPLPTPKQK